MDDKKLSSILSPEVPAEPDEDAVKAEEEKWEKLAADMANEELHKQYIGFILNSNMIKVATRRYGAIIDDKEKYSIEMRRLARKYQQSLVNLLFFTPQKEEHQRLSSLEAFGIFIAMTTMFAGLMMFFVDTAKLSPLLVFVLRMMLPVSLGSLAALLWRKFRKARSLMEKTTE